MSTKRQKRTFVVRGFNADNEYFPQPTGMIEDKTSFKEVTVDTQAQAVSLMLLDADLKTLAAPDDEHFNCAATDAQAAVTVLDLKIELGTADKEEVREMKTDLREVLKRWAEKSRVKNRRGFRANAIRTPVFEYDYYRDVTTMRTQVILGNAIVYNNGPRHGTAVVGAPTPTMIDNDVKLLSTELTKRLGHFVYNVEARA